MPYRSIDSLPDSIKDHLPVHAQEIFLEAFNHAWEQYKDPAKRRGDDSREEVARKVAWAAVKSKYEKNAQGKWVKK